MREHDHSDVTILSASPPPGEISFPARLLISLLIVVFSTFLLLYSAFAAREKRDLKAEGTTMVIPVAEFTSAH